MQNPFQSPFPQSLSSSDSPTFTGLTVTGTTTGGELTLTQIANGDTTLKIIRQTDSSPTGNYIDCRNAANNSSQFTIAAASGLMTTIGGFSTAGVGVPVLKAVTVGSASAASSGVKLFTTTASGLGQYLITFLVTVTTAATSSSTLGALTISWTSEDGSIAMTNIAPTVSMQSANLSANTIGTF